MRAQKLVRLVAAALLAAALVLGPVATSPAEAATKAKLTFTTEKVTFKTACGKVSVKLKTPVLKGSTKANRTRVAEWAKWLRKDVKKVLASNRHRCDGITSSAGSSAQGSIYKGRYLSVRMSWGGNTDETRAKFLNLDLKTGKKVPLSRFVSNKAGLFERAVCDAAGGDTGDSIESYTWCSWKSSTTSGSWWMVSSKGVRLQHVYAGEVLIPWKHIVKPDYKKQKKHVTKNVPMWWDGELRASKTKVTVQGNLVTVAAGGVTYHGVRGKAETGKYAWLEVFAPGQGDNLRGVRFASAKSNKAIEYVQAS